MHACSSVLWLSEVGRTPCNNRFLQHMGALAACMHAQLQALNFEPCSARVRLHNMLYSVLLILAESSEHLCVWCELATTPTPPAVVEM